MSSSTTTAGAGADRSGASGSIGLVAAAVAVTAWGGSGVLAKWLPMGALAIVAYRFAAYSILVGGLRAARGQRLTWQAFRDSLLGGLLLAADVALFFTALKLTSVVNATIIGSLQPLLLTAYGVRFLGERVERRDVLLGFVALVGAIVIVLGGPDSGEANVLGDLAALGALLAWSTYFVVAKLTTESDLDKELGIADEVSQRIAAIRQEATDDAARRELDELKREMGQLTIPVEATEVNKVTEGRPDVADLLKNERIDMIVNTTEGAQAIADEIVVMWKGGVVEQGVKDMILNPPYPEYTQVALIPIAYTKGTDFKPAYRPPVSTVMHVDQW